ncbi:hypothetical protein GCM10022280_02850 [Sphingomonas swuensis]|uniref:Uncharacterized protein n=1 Tax=Sphingomonas swuensis TaxID=977800 RepID=A0ABP7SBE0_9SPHN
MSAMGGKRTSANALEARPINLAAWQILQKRWLEHPEIYRHAPVTRVSGGPVRRAATALTMPQVQCAVALLIGDASSLDDHSIRSAIVPESGCPPTYRTIAFGGLGRFIAQGQSDLAAVAASVMFAHFRAS